MLLLFCFFIVNCNKRKTEISIKKQPIENGFIYHFFKGDSLLLDVGVSKSGNLKYLANFPEDHDQVIVFQERSGIIQSKLKKDKSTMKTNGRAYYFFEESGNLSSDYNYVNGVKSGSAVSYHDSTDRIKEVMLYNDIGELYYRKTFDKNGELLQVEGDKD